MSDQNEIVYSGTTLVETFASRLMNVFFMTMLLLRPEDRRRVGVAQLQHYIDSFASNDKLPENVREALISQLTHYKDIWEQKLMPLLALPADTEAERVEVLEREVGWITSAIMDMQMRDIP